MFVLDIIGDAPAGGAVIVADGDIGAGAVPGCCIVIGAAVAPGCCIVIGAVCAAGAGVASARDCN